MSPSISSIGVSYRQLHRYCRLRSSVLCIIGATAHRRPIYLRPIYLYKPGRSFEWTRAQSPFSLAAACFLHLLHKGPLRGPLFSAELHQGRRQRNDSATCRDDGSSLYRGVLLRRGQEWSLDFEVQNSAMRHSGTESYKASEAARLITALKRGRNSAQECLGQYQALGDTHYYAGGLENADMRPVRDTGRICREQIK